MSKKKETKVLIVEDSLILSQALEFGLKKAGFDVEVACNGQEGIDKIKSIVPKVVLLDIMMPIKNGLEVLEEVQDFKIENEIKIIMLTNFSEDENIEECFRLGADDFLVKANFTILDIVKMIKFFVK